MGLTQVQLLVEYGLAQVVLDPALTGKLQNKLSLRPLGLKFILSELSKL